MSGPAVIHVPTMFNLTLRWRRPFVPPDKFILRDHEGVVQAVHRRYDHPDGSKDMRWSLPGQHGGLQGRPASSLPLYGSEYVRDWPTDEWIVITEGEKAMWALSGLGMHTLATVGGARITPKNAVLYPIAKDRKFILWPDNDDVGRLHMERLAAALYWTGAASVLMIEIPPGWPDKADAWDFVAYPKVATPWLTDPGWIEYKRDRVAAFLGKWSRPVQPPGREPTRLFLRPAPTPARHRGGISVEDLVMRTGAKRQPNGSWLARCPAHEDRVASLSFRSGDRQELIARCHAGCEFSDILKAIGA